MVHRLRIPKRLKGRRIYRRLSGALVRIRQRKLMMENYDPEIQKLVIFLSPTTDYISGGVISITSIFNETEGLRNQIGADAIMCIVPGDPALIRYSKFDNRNFLYDLFQVLSYFTRLERVMIHVPEYAVGTVADTIARKLALRLHKIADVHFNILLQNVRFIPSRKDVDSLREFGKVTCTIAHRSYSDYAGKLLGIHPRYISWYVSLQDYVRPSYQEKSNLIIVSPDAHPRKEEILHHLKSMIPNMDIRLVKDIPYSDYRKLVASAKWTLTFGEGLDSYFLETVFSGGVGFAVYNSEFFTEDFKGLRTVYDSWDSLISRICEDIRELDTPRQYASYNRELYKICNTYYNPQTYRNGIQEFYDTEWDASNKPKTNSH
ncbi:MAG: hypothetical protein ACLP5V_08885 [Candidatus Bathyarchaeia archaeon]